MPPVPRVAIFGVALESNRMSPVAMRTDFEGAYLLRGDDILAQARTKRS